MLAQTQTGSPTYGDHDYNPILDILESFNFAQAQRVMHMLDWKWWHEDDTERIPTIPEMKEVAKTLLGMAQRPLEEEDGLEMDARFASTGGFVAWRHGEILRLYFSVEEWASHNELA